MLSNLRVLWAFDACLLKSSAVRWVMFLCLVRRGIFLYWFTSTSSHKINLWPVFLPHLQLSDSGIISFGLCVCSPFILISTSCMHIWVNLHVCLQYTHAVCVCEGKRDMCRHVWSHFHTAHSSPEPSLRRGLMLCHIYADELHVAPSQFMHVTARRRVKAAGGDCLSFKDDFDCQSC